MARQLKLKAQPLASDRASSHPGLYHSPWPTCIRRGTLSATGSSTFSTLASRCHWVCCRQGRTNKSDTITAEAIPFFGAHITVEVVSRLKVKGSTADQHATPWNNIRWL
eukprot:CAMPEP_0185789654 /NCGR_PEP_ID=MMETSP1174-20130828/152175_1 /TAXON_ID=35687 /ORGANISM="Dictyocha speculum, Strain CCMP1381" /LENGTH=108 /DNA_ID=CAMNT_0028483893 /DNA_START=55 /DNA_END=381 /DNA_ORIENTATION=-